MQREDTPITTNELLSALADGELDLREHPDALAKLAQDPQAAQRVACLQQLKQACGKAMDRPEMKCPDELADKLRAMGAEQAAKTDQSVQTHAGGATVEPRPAPHSGPAVIGRVGFASRWLPAAVAAVLLIAAGVMFTASNPGGLVGVEGQAAAFLPVEQIDRFTGRHGDCTLDTGLLKNSERFGDASDFNELPGKLADYFQTSTDGLRLSLDGIGYEYQIAGACPVPGEGAVHMVYRHKNDPNRAISVWLRPVDQRHADLKEGQVYANAGEDLMHPVIYWRQGELLYYLVGDSLEDCDKAVKQLRQSA